MPSTQSQLLLTNIALFFFVQKSPYNIRESTFYSKFSASYFKKLMKRLLICFNSIPAKDSFCGLLIIFENSLHQDKAQRFSDNIYLFCSVIECLTPDRGATGSSLTIITALWSLSKTHLSLLSTGSTQEDPFLFN